MADPSGIWLTFGADYFRDRIRLDSIICVVDAEQVFAVPELMELKLRQMAFADMILLNKIELVNSAQVDQIKAWLDSRFHRYRLVEASYGDVPLEILLAAGRFDPANAGHKLDSLEDGGSADPSIRDDHHAHDLSNKFSTWSYQSDLPFSLEALKAVLGKLPPEFYRAKGVIFTSDAPERRAVLQVVGKRVDISVQDGWGMRPPRTRIVVIGAAGGIDSVALQTELETAQVSASESI